jgi:hypothetical protein
MLALKLNGLGSCKLKAARQVSFVAGEALSTPGVAGECPVASYLIKIVSWLERPEPTKEGGTVEAQPSVPLRAEGFLIRR